MVREDEAGEDDKQGTAKSDMDSTYWLNAIRI